MQKGVILIVLCFCVVSVIGLAASSAGYFVWASDRDDNKDDDTKPAPKPAPKPSSDSESDPDPPPQPPACPPADVSPLPHMRMEDVYVDNIFDSHFLIITPPVVTDRMKLWMQNFKKGRKIGLSLSCREKGVNTLLTLRDDTVWDHTPGAINVIRTKEHLGQYSSPHEIFELNNPLNYIRPYTNRRYTIDIYTTDLESSDETTDDILNPQEPETPVTYILTPGTRTWKIDNVHFRSYTNFKSYLLCDVLPQIQSSTGGIRSELPVVAPPPNAAALLTQPCTGYWTHGPHGHMLSLPTTYTDEIRTWVQQLQNSAEITFSNIVVNGVHYSGTVKNTIDKVSITEGSVWNVLWYNLPVQFQSVAPPRPSPNVPPPDLIPVSPYMALQPVTYLPADFTASVEVREVIRTPAT